MGVIRLVTWLNEHGSEAGLLKNLLTFQQCLKCFATLHKQHRNFFQLRLFLSEKMCWSHEFQKHESETVIFGLAWEFNSTKRKLAIIPNIIIKGNITQKYVVMALIFPKNQWQSVSFRYTWLSCFCRSGGPPPPNMLIDSQHYKRHRGKIPIAFHSLTHFTLTTTQLILSFLKTLNYFKTIQSLVLPFHNLH